jgi:dihydroorotase
VRAGLADGALDCIATDHAPHTPEAKELPFDMAPPGMLGLETALALALGELSVDLVALFGLMSSRPASIAGIADRHGTIEVGRPANLCVLDPSVEWVVDAAALASRSRNTPFAGRVLRGRVRHTVYGGELVVRDGLAAR